MMLARMAMLISAAAARRRDGGSNPIALLAMVILAPIAAMLIQAAISRSREFAADAGGAAIAGNPYGLADALRKIDAASKRVPLDNGAVTASDGSVGDGDDVEGAASRARGSAAADRPRARRSGAGRRHEHFVLRRAAVVQDRRRDLYQVIEAHAKTGSTEGLDQAIDGLLGFAPGSVDGILCWDLFDYLGKSSGQLLAGRLARLLKKGGVLYGFFGTTPAELTNYTRYVVEAEDTLRQRTTPATPVKRTVLVTRQITACSKVWSSPSRCF